MVSALSIAPSQYFGGNDGSWSTFDVSIGTPPQLVRLLPATSESSIWPVLSQGCPANTPGTPGNCADLRGGIFNPDPSQDVSFQPKQAPDGSPYFTLPFDSEAGLGIFNANGLVGYDTVSLNWNGSNTPTNLQTQVVAGYAAKLPFIGLLGIRGIPNHIFNASSTQDSPLQSLKTNGNVPSLVFGYTAGAAYRNPQQFGSLTLGGYDAARINTSTALQLNWDATTTDLSVWVNRINIGDQSIGGLGAGGTFALIDSMLPDIWLPLAACQAFEQSLGLVWNSTYGMYLINDTQHASLLARNPTFTFYLGGTANSASSTPVTLPYAAFDLTAKWPLAGIADNTTTKRYFPLKRANDSTGYFLGRTFLQEAYISADYEQRQLTVGQALFPGSAASNIVTVNHSPPPSGLSAGAIAGIAVGSVLGVALIAGILFGLWWHRRQYFKRKARQDHRASSIGDSATLAAATDMDEREQRREDRLNEYFKPGPIFPPPEDEYLKPELDATHTATGFVRHELDATAARPAAHRSAGSWGSAGSNASIVSPVSVDGRVRSMDMSVNSDGTTAATHDPVSGGASPPAHARQISQDSVPGLHEMQ